MLVKLPHPIYTCCMKTILTLDQRTFDPSADIADRENYNLRRAVRAVVRDAEGAVALLHARQRDYYKLPGGGVEGSEELLIALERELLEELGCRAKVERELGQVVEWRDYWRLQQQSFSYTAEVIGEKGQPEFTESEIAEGFEIVWVPNVAAAITMVESVLLSADLPVKFMATRDAAILKAAQAAL